MSRCWGWVSWWIVAVRMEILSKWTALWFQAIANARFL